MCWPHVPDVIAEELMSPAHCNAVARASYKNERDAWIAAGRPAQDIWYRIRTGTTRPEDDVYAERAKRFREQNR